MAVASDEGLKAGSSWTGCPCTSDSSTCLPKYRGCQAGHKRKKLTAGRVAAVVRDSYLPEFGSSPEAAAQHLTTRINASQAATWLGQAAELLEKALEKTEQSPYLIGYVAFRDHLSGPPREAKPPEREEEFFPSDRP